MIVNGPDGIYDIEVRDLVDWEQSEFRAPRRMRVTDLDELGNRVQLKVDGESAKFWVSRPTFEAVYDMNGNRKNPNSGAR